MQRREPSSGVISRVPTGSLWLILSFVGVALVWLVVRPKDATPEATQEIEGKSDQESDDTLTWATVLEMGPDPSVVVDRFMREKIEATGLPWRVVHDQSGIEMLLIAGGSFYRSNRLGPIDKIGSQEVFLTRPVYIGRYEVTVAQWNRVMSASRGSLSTSNRPVAGISCRRVVGRRDGKDRGASFASLTGLRLPTEAEWEYACRAGTDTAYAFGNSIGPHQASYSPKGSKQRETTSDVGSYPANAWGFHDMHGNVYEFCADRYGDYGPMQLDAIDPIGDEEDQDYVVRGGAYNLIAKWLDSGFRWASSPVGSSDNMGFRVARFP